MVERIEVKCGERRDDSQFQLSDTCSSMRNANAKEDHQMKQIPVNRIVSYITSYHIVSYRIVPLSLIARIVSC